MKRACRLLVALLLLSAVPWSALAATSTMPTIGCTQADRDLVASDAGTDAASSWWWRNFHMYGNVQKAAQPGLRGYSC